MFYFIVIFWPECR